MADIDGCENLSEKEWELRNKPPEKVGDYCNCFGCGETKNFGMPGCEYFEHHCDGCHLNNLCTLAVCNKKPTPKDEYIPLEWNDDGWLKEKES